MSREGRLLGCLDGASAFGFWSSSEELDLHPIASASDLVVAALVAVLVVAATCRSCPCHVFFTPSCWLAVFRSSWLLASALAVFEG